MEDEHHYLNTAEITSVLETWQQFTRDDSPTSIINLDKVCLEIKELKSAAVARRKNLNEITKAFRSKTKEEQVNMMTEILKSYQEEIDHLSRRSKYSEAAFASLVKTLNETPDPCAAIESLLHTVNTGSVHTIEIERLRNELKQYDTEFQQLKNQDITIRRLEDQLQEFKDQIEEKVNEEVAARASEIEFQAENRVNEAKEMQRNLEKRLAAAIESMKQAQQSADRAQTQLFEMSTQVERRVSSLMSENSILAEGTQRLTLHLAETEAEISNLKKIISQQTANKGTISGDGGIPDKTSTDGTAPTDNQTLQLMVSELREELSRQEDLQRSEKQRLESSLRDAHQLILKEKESTNRVRVELAERPTKEDFISVKRQLKSLQKIAFNVQDDDDEELMDPENTQFGGGVGEQNHLEAMLTSRLKSLETELTDMRRELVEARHQETVAKDTVLSLKKALENSSNLIARLESDLEGKVAAFENSTTGDKNSSKHNNSIGGSMELAELLGVSESQMPQQNTIAAADGTTTGSGGNNNNSEKQKGVRFSDGVSSGNAEANAIINSNAANTTNSNTNNSSSSSSSNQMVSILQTQRDRYKEKLSAAENNMLKLQQKVDSVEASKTRLEADNLALYSKIRFLQSGGGGSGGGHHQQKASRNGYSNRASLATVSMNMGRRLTGLGTVEEGRGDDDNDDHYGQGGTDVEGRYHQLYEQRMNPFAEFSQHEKQRKLQELSVADRIVLNTTMAIVSNHTGRTVMLAYFGLMHLLVFFTIYYSAHHVHYGCDPSLDNHHGSPTAGSGGI